MDIDTNDAVAPAAADPARPALVGSLVAGEAPGASEASGAGGVTDELVVEGTYQPPRIDSATRTPTLLVDVPQSVSVVSEAQIEDQALRDLADVLRFTPGATPAQGEGHRDQVVIRGQDTTANFFVDGLRDDVQYFRPLYNVARVEVLKGASALAFGRGSGGGVINRVTKAPRLGEAFGEVSAGVTTFAGGAVSVDLNRPLGKVAAARLNAYYERLENHRDAYDGDRYAVNPTLAFEPDARTGLDLSYELVRDERVVDRGVPSLNGAPLTGFDATFFGDPDANETTLTAHLLRVEARRDLSGSVRLSGAVQYADYDKAYRNLYPVGFDPAAGTVSLDGYVDRTDRQNLLARGELVAEARTGRVGHTLLFGVEAADQETDNDRRDVLFAASGDDQVTFAFSDPLVIPAFSFPAFSRDSGSEVTTLSAYAQDQLDLGPIQLVAGLRYDRFEIDVTDRIAAAGGDDGELSRTDEEVSPRLGLVLKPAPNASVYASYSESFLPRSGDQFLTLSPSDEALGPERFETYELGAKWDLGLALSLTGAVFEIERDAGTTVDPDDPESTILIGARTRGAEAQLTGRVTRRLLVNAGYAYLDAKEDGRVVGGQDADRRLAQVPEHQASLWVRYELTDRLGLGLGATHQSSQTATIGEGATRLPGFTRVDAAAYYEVADGVRAQLNVENALDVDYFPAAHNDDNVTTGAPLNARLTLRAAF